MGTSVRTFSRAHPSADASYTLVLDRLDAAIARIEELAKQQERGATRRSTRPWSGGRTSGAGCTRGRSATW